MNSLDYSVRIVMEKRWRYNTERRRREEGKIAAGMSGKVTGNHTTS